MAITRRGNIFRCRDDGSSTPMKVAHTPGALKRFRKTPWRFQQTFATPLTDLDRFVASILSGVEGIDAAVVTIDGYVFEPKGLALLASQAAPAPDLGRDVSLSTDTRDEVFALLKASFGDWVDFLFIPQPRPFVIYADHDEYATFYAASKSNLNRVVGKLLEAGFRRMEGWHRDF